MKRGENLRRYDHSGPTYKTRPAEYRAWSHMKNRCTNSRFKDWPLYGGRGISVCQAWMESFEAFFAHVGPKPSLRHSLDRYPNGDGNYEPGNVRWATAIEQANNWTRRNRKVTFAGETLTLPEWSRRLGITRESLRDRLESGWPVEKALTVPAVRTRARTLKGRFADAV